jgi:DNA topoisomerase-1
MIDAKTKKADSNVRIPGFIPFKQIKTQKANSQHAKAQKHKPLYTTATGSKLPGELQSRLDSLYIPPAYSNLQLARSASNKIQVIGEDAAGRRQYIYHEKHKAGAEKRKYDKIAKFVPKIRAIESDNNHALRALAKKDSATWSKDDLVSLVLYMLVNYHFRIGCSKYAELYKSYGITTLKPAHFRRIGNTYHIEFVGKKGMKNQTDEKMPLAVRLINKLIARTKSNGFTYVFNYKYTNPITGVEDIGLVGSNDVQDLLLEKYNIKGTPKMFRTYYANYHMIEFIRDFMDTEEFADCRGNMKKVGRILKREIGEHVSAKLNNTPAICKKNYLNNALFEAIVNKPRKYLEKIKAVGGRDIHKLVIDLLDI